MPRSQTTAVYVVKKFYPPRCPKCLHDFRSSGDFGAWWGHGASWQEAAQEQIRSFDDLFRITNQADESVIQYDNRFSADFIFCEQCKNVTMRIMYAEQQVLTQDEAERLDSSLGYTCWTKGEAVGNMARPVRALFALGWLDLARLQDQVKVARDSAVSETDVWQRGDRFAEVLNPALANLVRQYQDANQSKVVRNRLQTIFGGHWLRLESDTRDFLLTAELITDELCARARTDPTLDFSAAVAMYSKALEGEILTKLFAAYRESVFINKLPESNDKGHVRSISALRDYAEGRRELTLGDMAFCL